MLTFTEEILLLLGDEDGVFLPVEKHAFDCALEEAFAAGSPPVGVGATAHAAALAWTMPGFAAFDTGGANDDNAAEAAPAEKPADASADATGELANKPHETSVAENIETPVPRNKSGALRTLIQ